VRPIEWRDACLSALNKIGVEIGKIIETYIGTTDFLGRKFREVFKDKTLHISDPENEGIGISQNHANVRPEWRMDLGLEDWFVFQDNFGTTEEKAFVAYFKEKAEVLTAKYDRVFLVRNERQLPIYSFANGERFEPDYLLFLQKSGSGGGYEQWQIFIEPKGAHLLQVDKWKESFLREIESCGKPVVQFADDNQYRILGFPFFNEADVERKKGFGAAIGKLA
jgi:type III restriction enzyme